MSAGKTEAIEQFQEIVDLERKVSKVISEVLARQPRALVIAWEDAEGTKVTSIPFSENLVKGMVDTLFDMVFKEADESDQDEGLSS